MMIQRLQRCNLGILRIGTDHKGKRNPPQKLVLTPNAERVIMTFGGNDMSFGTELAGCLANRVAGVSCEDIKEAMISALTLVPNAKVRVFTYPRIENAIPLPNRPGCSLSFLLQETANEIVSLHAQLMKSVVDEIANPRLQVVDVQCAFANRGPCSTNPLFTSLADQTPAHPTIEGQHVLADRVVQSLK